MYIITQPQWDGGVSENLGVVYIGNWWVENAETKPHFSLLLLAGEGELL